MTTSKKLANKLKKEIKTGDIKFGGLVPRVSAVKNLPNFPKSSPHHKEKVKPLSFDLKQLAKDCLAKREREGITMRDIKTAVGLSSITQYYTMEAMISTPGANNLAKIIDWLGEPVQKYFVRK